MSLKKYFICTGCASDLIPNALHIERNDECAESKGITDDYDDFNAAKDAMKDGIKLIDDIDGIYKNFYIDTPENRNVIKKYLSIHPDEVNANLIGKFNKKDKQYI